MVAPRRVVVTGVGVMSPLAVGYEQSWHRLLQGQSGAGPIDLFDSSELPCRIAFQVPHKNGAGGGDPDDPCSFDPDLVMPKKQRRRLDTFSLYAIAAADEAIADSGWKPESEEEQIRTGVMIGTGIGGLSHIEKSTLLVQQKGVRQISPFFIPSCLPNMAAGHVSIRHGCKGPSQAVVTACAAGSHAIGDSAMLIRNDRADVMLAGATEASICRISIAGFCACKALSTHYNDQPQKASRPFDAGRDGFVMGEGAAVLVLEELEHAKARGAKIMAEITGYGACSDAFHITAPDNEGKGAERTIGVAMEDAGVKAEELDYINAHGTSTPAGDEIELLAIERIMGKTTNNVSISSTKSAVGHLLGAAGAIEAIFSILAIRDQIVPPTLNLDNPIDTPMDLTPHRAKSREIKTVMSNSFGFGGTNATLIFKAFT